MDAAGFWIQIFGEVVEVSIFQFDQAAIIENQLRNGVFVRKFFEDFHIGAVAGLGLLDGFQAKAVEQHILKLLGRIRIEFEAG